MVCTIRDHTGEIVNILGLGICQLFHDIVDYEFHRFRIQKDELVVLGDYFYSMDDARTSVFKRLKRKLDNEKKH